MTMYQDRCFLSDRNKRQMRKIKKIAYYWNPLRSLRRYLRYAHRTTYTPKTKTPEKRFDKISHLYPRFARPGLYTANLIRLKLTIKDCGTSNIFPPRKIWPSKSILNSSKDIRRVIKRKQQQNGYEQGHIVRMN